MVVFVFLFYPKTGMLSSFPGNSILPAFVDPLQKPIGYAGDGLADKELSGGHSIIKVLFRKNGHGGALLPFHLQIVQYRPVGKGLRLAGGIGLFPQVGMLPSTVGISSSSGAREKRK